ncbi:hypothetical protein BRCON_2419 [Candidatus Sumerlaea chitinivorans]|jgi:hypothetical protein|uniref:Uncharacterized protein n=1 Tax=Sumerlaea chitinivorans TaxID=2250252 RepID=A0A2Z4Y8K7_SUMC1|nr:hypothetical protein BRCON_2419 [Candidatus Sumerlaea chitinivorans]
MRRRPEAPPKWQELPQEEHAAYDAQHPSAMESRGFGQPTFGLLLASVEQPPDTQLSE